jgi:N-acetylglucosaminyldiphosphoundecaprenol N-acetyl-beta-D-mannosaminyltransferase
MNNKPALTSHDFLEYQISCEPVSELAARSMAAIRHHAHNIVFACANPHSLNVARKDERFRQALLHSNMLVADGVGLTTLAKLFGKGTLPRVTGTDYFEKVMSTLNAAEAELGRKGRVFFFGSTPKVLALIASQLNAAYPNLELAGTLSPPFGDWNSDMELDMLEKIKAGKPDVLWVGMTAPKQEKWADKNCQTLDVPVIGSIGAVFDFFAGTYPRAPSWACATGLEWLVRLVREPRRMWRRTIVSLPLFAMHASKYYLLGSSANTDSANR